MMEIRPFQSTYNINLASNPNFDAWQGAKDFANSTEFKNSELTKNDYLEFGGEYLKEHYASNQYFPTPAPIVTEPTQMPIETENDTTNNISDQIKDDENIFDE